MKLDHLDHYMWHREFERLKICKDEEGEQKRRREYEDWKCLKIHT